MERFVLIHVPQALFSISNCVKDTKFQKYTNMEIESPKMKSDEILNTERKMKYGKGGENIQVPIL